MFGPKVRRGVTILDLIMTTSLIGIVTAFGAPELQEALRRRTVQAAGDEFTTAHSLARATAIRYGRVAQLHLDPAARRFWIEVDTSANDIGQRATIWYERTLTDAGVQMSSDRSILCFDARGLAYDVDPCEAGDAQLVFSVIDAADTVQTTVLGKVLR
jgi:Tfp pilus assembly protein FimT